MNFNLITVFFAIMLIFFPSKAAGEKTPDAVDGVDGHMQHIQFLKAPYVLSSSQLDTARSIVRKLSNVQKRISDEKFNLISFSDIFDEKLYPDEQDFIAATRFTKEEKAFIENIFSLCARKYGFNDPRLTSDLFYEIDKNDIIKIAGSNQYLFKDDAYDTYMSILEYVKTKDAHTFSQTTVTSGIRGIPKQLHIFLRKVIFCDGSLSKASKSVAPPGYSYHLTGDFDIGIRGLGYKNFTLDFKETKLFKYIMQIDSEAFLRYPEKGQSHVQFEPWHIRADALKIITSQTAR